MVILNTEFTINRVYTINSIKNIMEQVMENYFEDEILVNKIENKKKLFKNIVKEKIDFIKSSHFWYLNSYEGNCVHIFKKGKKASYMCQRKIRTNLDGEKKDYLCCTHSKIHIPKKKNTKIKHFKDKSLDKHINNNIILKHNNKVIFKKKKNLKKKKKVYCNGIINFKDIIDKLLL
jgi:hypothetical protein